MKWSGAFLTALLIGLSIVGGVTPGLKGQSTGHITVLSTPPGARIQLDSTWIGNAPLYDVAVPPGRHVLRAYPPYSGIWNIADQTITFHVQSGQDTTIQFTFTPPLFINSIPPQATVFLDSTEIAQTPAYIPYLRVKGKMLLFTKRGYQPAQVVVQSNHPLQVTLQKKEGFTEEKRPPLLKIVPQNNRAAKFTLMATTLFSHWAAFLLKRKADTYHEKYQRTAQPDEILRYWNQTRKYDRYSDIALATSYISLSAFIYLVIFK